MPAYPQKRRVLYVLQNLPVPFDRRAWLQAATLAKNGYDVSVICPKARGFNRSRERLEDVEIHRYWSPIEAKAKPAFIAEFIWCFAATFLLSLRIGLFGRGFDILHVCNPPETYWPMAWFWRLFGKSFIWDHRDLSPELAEAKWGKSDGLVMKGLLLFEKLTFRAAQIVISTNESYRKIALGRGGKPAADVFIVRSAPALSRFRVYPPDPAWKRGKPNLVLYLGEICEQDGVEHLVRAVKRLRDRLGRGDFHCILVGGGPHQPAVVAAAEAEGVADLCTFTGTISDDEILCRILSSADVAVEPVPRNGWSDRSTANKIVEYMFFGLPIVSSDLVEARFSAGDAAVYSEPGDPASMAAAIATLLDDPDRRRDMGERGRIRLHNELAFEFSIPPLLAAYDAAWARCRRGQAARAPAYQPG